MCRMDDMGVTGVQCHYLERGKESHLIVASFRLCFCFTRTLPLDILLRRVHPATQCLLLSSIHLYLLL